MVLARFCEFLIQLVGGHRVKGVRAQVLMIQINQMSSVNGLQIGSNLLYHIDENSINTFSLSIYLSIPTKLLPVTWDRNWHCSIIGLYLNSITVDQPEFEPGSPRRTKIGYAIFVLCSSRPHFLKAIAKKLGLVHCCYDTSPKSVM